MEPFDVLTPISRSGACPDLRQDVQGFAAPASSHAPPLDRFLVPTSPTLGETDPGLVQWARDRKIDVELLHADRSPGQSAFDAVLADLAAHTDRATARTTAKYIEYPTGHLDLTGAGWPRRPAGLLVVALLLAVGVGLLPHTVRPAIRRVRRWRAEPVTALPAPPVPDQAPAFAGQGIAADTARGEVSPPRRPDQGAGAAIATRSAATGSDRGGVGFSLLPQVRAAAQRGPQFCGDVSPAAALGGIQELQSRPVNTGEAVAIRDRCIPRWARPAGNQLRRTHRAPREHRDPRAWWSGRF